MDKQTATTTVKAESVKGWATNRPTAMPRHAVPRNTNRAAKRVFTPAAWANKASSRVVVVVLVGVRSCCSSNSNQQHLQQSYRGVCGCLWEKRSSWTGSAQPAGGTFCILWQRLPALSATSLYYSSLCGTELLFGPWRRWVGGLGPRSFATVAPSSKCFQLQRSLQRQKKKVVKTQKKYRLEISAKPGSLQKIESFPEFHTTKSTSGNLLLAWGWHSPTRSRTNLSRGMAVRSTR